MIDDPAQPIVIALHGLGHHKEGFLRLAEGLPKSWRIFAIDAPLLYRRGRAWYRFRCPQATLDLERSLDALMKTVDEITHRFPKAPKPAIFGFSQGGVMTLSAFAHNPLRWGSAASLSGYWLSSSSPRLGTLIEAPSLLIAHGLKDRVVPFFKGQEAAEKLGAAGAQIAWLPFDGAHHISPIVLQALEEHFEQAMKTQTP